MQSVPFYVGLNVVTLIMCILTLTMATAALMPQLKYGLVLLRDGLLWTILLGVLLTVAFIGWSRLHEARQLRAQERDFYELQVPPVVGDTSVIDSTTGTFSDSLSQLVPFGESQNPPSRYDYSTRDIVVESSFARPEELQEFTESFREARPVYAAESFRPADRGAYETRFASDRFARDSHSTNTYIGENPGRSHLQPVKRSRRRLQPVRSSRTR